jgi:N-formylglutamate deformylase
MIDFLAPWRDDSIRIHLGDAPLIVSLPHDGSEIPADIARTMVPEAIASPDTDWHVAALYAFARDLGATLIRPRYSRYVIDLNRPRDGAALYPGRAETGLCPTVMFDGRRLYRDTEPTPGEIAERIDRYWSPYHTALDEQLHRLRQHHPNVLLWEGHSIRSRCPMFFDGILPDYNIGTANGSSCAASIEQAVVSYLAQADRSFVLNGRFKGGYITRHYGRPSDGVHALQMEMAQSRYLDEAAPQRFDSQRAAAAVADLEAMLGRALGALQAR